MDSKETKSCFEKVAIFMVLYNPNKNVFSAIKSYSKFHHMYIFDNSIKNNEKELIMNGYIGFYHFNNQNVGYTSGLNYLLSIAMKNLYINNIMIVDQETFFEENNYYEFYDFFESNQDIGVLSPKYKIDRKKYSESKKEATYSKWVMFNGTLIKKSLFFKLGGFDNRFFIDWSDYDFCLSAYKIGYKICTYNHYTMRLNAGITKQAKFIHYKFGYCSPLRIYYQFRDGLLCFKKHHYLKILIILFYKFAKILLLFDNKKLFICEMFRGINDFRRREYNDKCNNGCV